MNVTQHGYTIDVAMRDDRLLGAALGNTASWSTWIAVLKAAFGLGLTDEQRELFASVAGQRMPPRDRVRELWCLCGRRAGKSRIAALVAVYVALFAPVKLAPGERGAVLVLANGIDQAGLVFSYARALITESPVLRREIVSVTKSEIRLRNGITIAVHANSFRSVRGWTLLACIFDEVSFWRDESSAQPDVETYTACLPSLLTTNGMLIGIRAGYRHAGLIYAKHREHFGQETPTFWWSRVRAGPSTLRSARLASPPCAPPTQPRMHRNGMPNFAPTSRPSLMTSWSSAPSTTTAHWNCRQCPTLALLRLHRRQPAGLATMPTRSQSAISRARILSSTWCAVPDPACYSTPPR